MPTPQPNDDPDDVLFSSLYGVRTIELNRPAKLNSLNGSMARKILPRLREYEKSQMANVIMITGSGPKAFCAGGDVAELAQQNATPQGQKKSADYFALEYQLDHLIATYSKPYVAVMDGITMGGGVGLSVHAPFRIATEKTVFAMPETTIGFFPDVGGSFFLPRMDGEIGTYLALTSERLLGSQVFYAGIATHYVDSSVLQALTSRLAELNFRDYASLQERCDLIDSTISEFATQPPSPSAETYPKAKYGDVSGPLRDAIDRCFGHNSISEILSALRAEAEGSGEMADWAQKTSETIAQRSPTSLKVTLRQLRLGKKWKIGETFVREHAIASKFCQGTEFREGVTARLIKKPPQKPDWNPSKLTDVTDEEVETYFQVPQAGARMELLSGAEGKRIDYADYPHAKYALPRESAIEAVIANKGREGVDAVVREVGAQWNNKVGVEQKVKEVIQRKCSVNNGEVRWQHAQKAKLP